MVAQDFSHSLLTSLRYDDALLTAPWNTRINDGTPSKFMLLRYHFDRLRAAAREHQWHPPSMSFEGFENKCKSAAYLAQEQSGTAPLKLRVLLSHDGDLTVFASPAAPLTSPDYLSIPLAPLTTRIIYVDSQATPTSLYTRTKTTHRPMYNVARARANLTPLPQPSDAHIDVLLYNSDGFITETSIRNVAFCRGNEWVTPKTKSGCLPGVFRRLLLEEGLVVEGDIRKEEVQLDEIVMTYNGVEGCCFARIAFIQS